jgi:hypothetical protein
MTSAERERLLEMIRNPKPGSKIAAAKEFGIDLTLTFENLLLTPTERLRQLEEFSGLVEEFGRNTRDTSR